MSGGHFNHSYYHFNMFADDLEEEILHNNDKNDCNHSYDFSNQTIKELNKIIKLCRKCANLVYEVEYLYSGDIGEESFLKNIKEIK